MSASTAARPVCLTIGGSDSCGGAGIQADLRVFETFGVHGCSAITALTAQNPRDIGRVESVALVQLDAEMHSIFDYYDVAVVKTGMLVDAEHAALVSGLLSQLHTGPLVVDPVILSSSGTLLLGDGGVDALLGGMTPQAGVVTPNLDEADVLLGKDLGYAHKHPVNTAKALRELMGCAVLLKGGHADTTTLLDVLCDGDGSIHRFTHARQHWSAGQRHGTGCRLASAVAAELAHQRPLAEAVDAAIIYLQESEA